MRVTAKRLSSQCKCETPQARQHPMVVQAGHMMWSRLCSSASYLHQQILCHGVCRAMIRWYMSKTHLAERKLVHALQQLHERLTQSQAAAVADRMLLDGAYNNG